MISCLFRQLALPLHRQKYSDDMEGKQQATKKLAVLAASLGIVFVLVRNRQSIWTSLRRTWHFNNPLMQKRTVVISSFEESQKAVKELKKHCQSYKVLGFDCEWVSEGGSRHPVALLQLCSHKGLCALFRLCCMKQIPKDLRELLEDDAVIKVGVVPQDDAMKLSHDYGVGVASTLDLRFMAVMAGHKPEGLGKLAKTHLNIELSKHWRLACSNWEAKILQAAQVNYAANDALAAVAIFQKLFKDLEPRPMWGLRATKPDILHPRLGPFLDRGFSQDFAVRITANASGTQPLTMKPKKMVPKKQQCRNLGTRSKAFYDNCLLEAPDGELLCTIDRRKASWYLSQNLGSQIKDSPLTVRLNFEPAGRAVGDVGRYYQTPKENQCVVCGRRDAFIRKNVVPHEYRKHFPLVMKSHTSHDVLLHCPTCHQVSNISDLKVRTKLAAMCDAPIKHSEGAAKFLEDQELKRVRSAARALLYQRAKLPEAKVAEMERIVLDYYQAEHEVTESLLTNAANLEFKFENPDYCEHAGKVVRVYGEKYGGLIELERVWREHFLHTLQPKFLPELWNVNHNADRLEVRASEGRVDNEDLLLAGLDPIFRDTKTA
ncbi:exonuclease 3'-5' domain-containing protein 2 isoform X2 [Scaptodrosophila lebanonensis]|uniref:Exonuclease 3'-5' domain-containing protein 2 n=1 Tax=Drosophila lebanonensis TaxID=7225 RepID=A0A6J2TEN8_DROLE|nr:exonuclease 3'-5' domain-containing protein 2 isoform X2 [Scaptodrosophila lebanonensis]